MGDPMERRTRRKNFRVLFRVKFIITLGAAATAGGLGCNQLPMNEYMIEDYIVYTLPTPPRIMIECIY